MRTFYATKEGLPPLMLMHEALGTSGRTTKFHERETGGWIWRNAGPGDYLIAYRVSRLGRNLADILRTVEHLTQRGVKIIALDVAHEPLDDKSLVGKIVLTVLALCAQIESDLLSERVQTAMAYRRKCGIVPLPKWVRRNIAPAGAKPQWVVDDEALARILQFARWRTEGIPLNKIGALADKKGWIHTNGKSWGADYGQRIIQALHWLERETLAGRLPEPCPNVVARFRRYARLRRDYGNKHRSYKQRKEKERKIVLGEREGWSAEQWQLDYIAGITSESAAESPPQQPLPSPNQSPPANAERA
jgi:hypothetical protein